MKLLKFGLCAALVAAPSLAAEPQSKLVDASNFARAETDLNFAKTVETGAFGKLLHTRRPTAITRQAVPRMNRDTLSSTGVFDLDAGPVTITLPDVGKRFMSMQIVSQDHYTTAVVYAPGRYTYTREDVGTRYMQPIIRTLVDPQDAEDLKAAREAQEAIGVKQAAVGDFQIPRWDRASQDKARNALNELESLGVKGVMFGSKDEVDPVSFLIGSAIGVGGIPPSAAVYASVFPPQNDGETVHVLTVKDVPVDGFWSISVYNAEGFFEKNDRGAYSLNSLTAKPDLDGAVQVQFGGCDEETLNCLPITAGWNYTVRLYRPREEILDGSWSFPAAHPASE